MSDFFSVSDLIPLTHDKVDPAKEVPPIVKFQFGLMIALTYGCESTSDTPPKTFLCYQNLSITCFL